MVTSNQFYVHIETVTTRTIQREIHSNENNVEPASSFKNGDQVWVLFNNSKLKERFRWIHPTVVEAVAHS